MGSRQPACGKDKIPGLRVQRAGKKDKTCRAGIAVERKLVLEELNEWRNANAHQDFVPAMLRGGRAGPQLAQVRRWRRACNGLARSFDDVMRSHIRAITGTFPW
jgi:hypothetical protein